MPQFRYVEEFVRYQLSQSLGGARGMIESALPFIAFTIAWVLARQLYPAIAAAVGTAILLAVIRLVQRQSIKYVVQAVIPTAIAVLIATRTGRAQDVFLPGILYNGALAVISLLTVAFASPSSVSSSAPRSVTPQGWTRDRGLVKMTSKLTLVLAGAIRCPFRHPAAALPGRTDRVARHSQSCSGLADADRRPDRDRVHALEGQNPDGGFCFRAFTRTREPSAERFVVACVLGDCMYARRRCLGDADRAVARGKHLGKLLLEILCCHEQQFVARL
jgi:hypothetical protein